MEELRRDVEAVLITKYPNARFDWDDDPLLSRLSGYVISDQFRNQPQLARQLELGDYLRTQLRERATGLGLIFAYTPEEWAEKLAAA